MRWLGSFKVISNVTIGQSISVYLSAKFILFLKYSELLAEVADFDLLQLYFAPHWVILFNVFLKSYRVFGLLCGVVCMILRLDVSVEYRLVPDRQTDRQTDMTTAYTAQALHRSVKSIQNETQCTYKRGVSSRIQQQ